MTPKEKADELYEAFFYSIPSFTDEGQLEHKTAKQCALIAVKEVALILNGHHKDAIISPFIEYWKEVKQEIEKI